MNRIFLLLYFSLAASAPVAASNDSVPPDSMPNQATPKEVAEAWLRFHELDLCQGTNATFVFSKDCLEVRTLVEDEKSQQKLEGLLAPLRSFYKIELQATRLPEEVSPEERREPPASLWENYELRSFMGDPVALARERHGFEEDLDAPPFFPNGILKQRLLLYADQILAWKKKIDRYAADLPILTRVLLEPTLQPAIRTKANAVCRTHTQNLGKYAEKLETNLAPAFPRPDKKRPKQAEKDGPVLKTLIDRAEHLRVLAASVSEGIYRFIYPERYTVRLNELRQPELLESLKALRKADLDFQKALAKLR